MVQLPDFKGYLSDLGGPSANMYGMHGKNLKACERCKRPSCIHPAICPNLNADHSAILDIYHAVDALPQIKKSFIGSGVRYDLLLYRSDDEKSNKAAEQYTRELICRHVSGRLKVAPEHTSDRVLHLMRKPSFKQFHQFKRIFDRINSQEKPAPATHSVFHIFPPWMQGGRHGRTGCRNKTTRFPTGTGAGLHSHPYDRGHRNMVHWL